MCLVIYLSIYRFPSILAVLKRSMPLIAFSLFVLGNVFPPFLYIENKTNVIRYSTNILLIKLVLNLRVNLSRYSFQNAGILIEKGRGIVGEELERERNKEKREKEER